MKKKTSEPKPDIAKVVSVMGKSKFNDEVVKEVQGSNIPVGEAADLIARRKLKGMI
jgi:hypothetical protein